MREDHKFKKSSKYSITSAFLVYIVSLNSSAQDLWFNPLLISDNVENVADLSNFEKGQEIPDGFYKVDVYINNNFLSALTLDFKFNNDKRKMQPYFNENEIGLMPIKHEYIPKEIKTTTTIDEIFPDAKTNLDIGKLRLDISIPQLYIDNKAKGYIPPSQWSSGITSAIINYNYSGGNYDYKGSSSNRHYLNLRSGLNIGAWRLRDYSTWNYNSSKQGSKTDFNHINTTLSRDLGQWRSRLIIGDTYTSSNLYDGVSFRGIKLTSEESMLPDSLRNFAPVVRGIAKGTAVVSIKQSGYEIYQETVPAGPFEINDLNSVGSGGDLYVTIKEADGSTQSFTVPWSSLPNMQRAGGFQYAINFGEVRNGGAEVEKNKFVMGEFYYGLKNDLTLFSGTQLSKNYNSFTLGSAKNLGTLGAVSLSVTQAHSKLADNSSHDGQQFEISYQKNLEKTDTDIHFAGYRYSTSGYYDFNDTNYKYMNSDKYDNDDNYYYDLNFKIKGKTSINISQPVGFGSIYLSGENKTYWNTSKKETLLQVGYSTSYNGISFSTNYSNNKTVWNDKNDQMLSFNMSVPMSLFLSPDSTAIYKNSYISNSFVSDLNGSLSDQMTLSGNLLENDALSYNISQGYNKNERTLYQSSISGSYFSPKMITNVGYSYNKDSSQLYYSMSGGALIHSDGITFGQSLNQTAILVKAPGASNTPIAGHRGISTDSRGYALIPYASNYRVNRVELDITKLPKNVEIENAIVSVVPDNDAVVLASFDPQVGYKAFINITYKGNPVPFGAIATIENKSISSFVGDAGQAYIAGLNDKGMINVKWGNQADQACSFTYDLSNIEKNQSIVNFSAQCQ
ncbi:MULTISPECIES: fimbria/pilus outer membrane usher protein [Enterobacterales]|uniref:fimbria/pilus outer membrane usher protein n=1 Tax=Enterobacterales TaxID=91347 RepID=UPI000847F67D|nr:MULTISPECIES: fimbria/pilus outer membrane usher protein [Enterobacterales]WOO49726.1 fimbria/pilus outer membrane usher protein [Hafnia alvei]MCT6518550.1 fimbrial biogenesis outer membrane usher protein [Proteus vulgaris]ODQ03825.1 hypothetical protein BGK50_07275 [Shigella sp. FC130]OEI91510.1 hypothetical protein BHE86_08765 [Shigella sp. FC1655]WPF04190.1 fimbria/pilus outer membrane usher protein [Proteus vulgaris]